MIILAFETSCDETSVAVLDNEKVLSNIIHSQLFHSEFGGVVPEIASREHLSRITGITQKALKEAGKELKDIELICSASEPGLIGALLIGLNYGKSLAVSLDVPFVPVNHIQAHIYSSFITDDKPEFPFISLIVSGGHTLLIKVDDFFRHKILGTTIDDAAGEAFDKVAKMLGLGYPGGPLIDKKAKTGNKDFHKFPIASIKGKPFDFSFSGIKTSVLYFLRNLEKSGKDKSIYIDDICASFQKAVVDTLYFKAKKAAELYEIKNISISGGVSANSGLRVRFCELEKSGYRIFIPEADYTTDNAGMIGITGFYKYRNSSDKEFFRLESLKTKAAPRLDFANF